MARRRRSRPFPGARVPSLRPRCRAELLSPALSCGPTGRHRCARRARWRTRPELSGRRCRPGPASAEAGRGERMAPLLAATVARQSRRAGSSTRVLARERGWLGACRKHGASPSPSRTRHPGRRPPRHPPPIHPLTPVGRALRSLPPHRQRQPARGPARGPARVSASQVRPDPSAWCGPLCSVGPTRLSCSVGPTHRTDTASPRPAQAPANAARRGRCGCRSPCLLPGAAVKEASSSLSGRISTRQRRLRRRRRGARAWGTVPLPVRAASSTRQA